MDQNIAANDALYSTERHTEKLQRELLVLERSLANPKTNLPQKIVLLSTGTYSPAHSMHINTFVVAQKFLQENNIGEVIACIIVPASDEYAKMKLGVEAIPFVHRKKILELHACNSPLKDITIISPAESHWGLFYTQALALYQREIAKKFPNKEILVKFLCGSDIGNYLLYDTFSFKKHGCVIVQRPNNSIDPNHIQSWMTVIPGSGEVFSSTRLRTEKYTALDLVGENVMMYLKQHRLLDPCLCGGRFSPASNCNCNCIPDL